jgi:hypothetical protein
MILSLSLLQPLASPTRPGATVGGIVVQRMEVATIDQIIINKIR